jgi:hypothetical protein
VRATRRTRRPGVTRALRRAAGPAALAVAIGAVLLPGLSARAVADLADRPAVVSPGPGDDRHGDDGGSRRGRERELRHGLDDGTPHPRERRLTSPSPRSRPSRSPTRVGSPAVAPVQPARPVSVRSPSHQGVSARVAAIAGMGGLLILAALLTVGGRRLARMRSM